MPKALSPPVAAGMESPTGFERAKNGENFCFGDTQLSHTLFLVAISTPTVERFLREIRVYIPLAEELRKPFAGILLCDETTLEDARKRGWEGQQGNCVYHHLTERAGQSDPSRFNVRA